MLGPNLQKIHRNEPKCVGKHPNVFTAQCKYITIVTGILQYNISAFMMNENFPADDVPTLYRNPGGMFTFGGALSTVPFTVAEIVSTTTAGRELDCCKPRTSALNNTGIYRIIVSCKTDTKLKYFIIPASIYHRLWHRLPARAFLPFAS